MLRTHPPAQYHTNTVHSSLHCCSSHADSCPKWPEKTSPRGHGCWTPLTGHELTRLWLVLLDGSPPGSMVLDRWDLQGSCWGADRSWRRSRGSPDTWWTWHCPWCCGPAKAAVRYVSVSQWSATSSKCPLPWDWESWVWFPPLPTARGGQGGARCQQEWRTGQIQMNDLCNRKKKKVTKYTDTLLFHHGC